MLTSSFIPWYLSNCMWSRSACHVVPAHNAAIETKTGTTRMPTLSLHQQRTGLVCDPQPVQRIQRTRTSVWWAFKRMQVSGNHAHADVSLFTCRRELIHTVQLLGTRHRKLETMKQTRTLFTPAYRLSFLSRSFTFITVLTRRHRSCMVCTPCVSSSKIAGGRLRLNSG
jgi:hypothetical protein